MTTLQNEPDRSHAFLGLLLFILVFTASILTWQVIASLRTTGQVEVAPLKPVDPVAADAVKPNPNQLTAAAALATGESTLFYFYPADICSLRYCRQPEMIASELARLGHDEVNIVQITAHAIPLDAENGEASVIAFENWDLSPVTPYREWLPELTETPFGLGLVRPEIVLVDSSGNLMGQFDEFVDFSYLKKYLRPEYLDSPTSMV